MPVFLWHPRPSAVRNPARVKHAIWALSIETFLQLLCSYSQSRRQNSKWRLLQNIDDWNCINDWVLYPTSCSVLLSRHRSGVDLDVIPESLPAWLPSTSDSTLPLWLFCCWFHFICVSLHVTVSWALPTVRVSRLSWVRDGMLGQWRRTKSGIQESLPFLVPPVSNKW